MAYESHFLDPPYVRRPEFVPASNRLLALRRGEIDMAERGIGDEPVLDITLEPFRSDQYGILEIPGVRTGQGAPRSRDR